MDVKSQPVSPGLGKWVDKWEVVAWGWSGNLCPWNPASYLTPLVNATFDLIPQGSKHLKPRLSSVSLNSTLLL